MNYNQLLNEFFDMEMDNVKCGEKECTIKLVVPGYGKEDFSINVEGNELNILVDKYKKVYTIGEGIDVSSISAKCVNGILTINLPKKVADKKVVKVKVQ